MDCNLLHQGDCVEGLGKLEPASVDLAFADPPFNIGYDYDVYDDRRDGRRITSTGRGRGAGRSSACSSPTAPSGWPSATITPPS